MSLRFKNNIIRFIFFIVLSFPTSGFCQSMIEGNIYFYDTKEPAIVCNLLITDTIKTDSIVYNVFSGSTGLQKGTIIDGLSDIDGNFEIKNIQKSKIDLLISFVGYRNTIVKNIPLNNDTIQLYGVPLFIDDNVIHVNLVLNNRQRFFSRFRKKYWHDQSIIGTEGPFTYMNELEINCMNNSAIRIKCKKTRFGIEIDYKEIKTCGNRVSG